MKPALDLEKAFLFLVTLVMLYLGLGNLWGHTLSHPIPQGYLASDAFQHSTRADAILTMGNYKFEAPWISAGYTDVIGFYPPGLYYLAIPISLASGLAIHDAIFVAGFAFAILAALLFYFVMKRFNAHAAIIGLPFSLLIFTGISMDSFTWGAYPAVVAQAFLILVFWALLYLEQRWAFIPLAIALSGVVFTHSSELLFAVALMGILFLWLLAAHFGLKKHQKLPLINMILGGALFGAISAYSIIIAKLVLAEVYTFKPFAVITTHSGFRGIVSIMDWGIFIPLFAIGLIASGYYLWKNKEHPPIALLVGIVMLVLGLGNFYGLDYRAFQIRYVWPIYLSVFVGLGIFTIMLLALRKMRKPYALGAGAVVLVLVAGIIPISAIPHYTDYGQNTIMTQPHWDVFNWLRENTPKDALVFFFYGDIYQPNADLRQIQRDHHLILLDNMKENPNQIVVQRQVKSALLGDCCGTGYPYWKGFMSVGFHYFENGGREGFYKPNDVCSMDYYVFDMVTSQLVQAAYTPAQYNGAYFQAMMSSGHFTPVFQNDYTVILKNDKPGEPCLGNQTG